jgi:hypothetical protein
MAAGQFDASSSSSDPIDDHDNAPHCDGSFLVLELLRTASLELARILDDA